MEKTKLKLEPGIYYINGSKVTVYEETTEEELLGVVRAAKELMKKYGKEGWI